MSRFYELHENCGECPMCCSSEEDYICCITGTELTVQEHSDQIDITGKHFPEDCPLPINIKGEQCDQV